MGSKRRSLVSEILNYLIQLLTSLSFLIEEWRVKKRINLFFTICNLMNSSKLQPQEEDSEYNQRSVVK